MKKVIILRTGQYPLLEKLLGSLRGSRLIVDLFEPNQICEDFCVRGFFSTVYCEKLDLSDIDFNVLSEIKNKNYEEVYFLINEGKYNLYENVIRFAVGLKIKKIYGVLENGHIINFNIFRRINYYIKQKTLWFSKECKFLVKYFKLRFLAIISITFFWKNRFSRDDSKVLLLIDRFSPLFNGANVRWVKHIKYLSDKYKFTIITSKDKTVNEAAIISDSLLKDIPVVDVKRFERDAEAPCSKIFNIIPVIDEYMFWCLKTLPGVLKYVFSNRIGTIVISGPLFSNVIIGYYLKQIFSLQLILDFGDEWTISALKSFQRLNTSYARKWERKVLYVADKLVVATDSQKDNYIKNYPFVKDKVFVIPNGCDYDDLKFIMLERERNITNIDFFGTFNNDRDSCQFLRTIKRLKGEGLLTDKKIRFFGRYSEGIKLFQDKDLINIVEVKGMLDRGEMFRVMRDETDVLLTVASPDSGNYIAGKSYEYLLSGKPIIAIVPEGEAMNLFAAFDGVFIGDVKDENSIFVAFSSALRNSSSRFYNRQEGLKENFHKNIANQYAKIIDKHNV